MRRVLLLTGLFVALTSAPALSQTRVPDLPRQLYVPAVSSPLPVESLSVRAETTVKRPAVLVGMYASLIGLQAMDLYSTNAALANGAVEQNPLFTSVRAPAGQIALKSALTASSILLVERLWKKEKRVASVLAMVAANGLMAAVVHRNMQNAAR